MTFDEHQVLERFHRALVRALQAKDPQSLHSPFSVAEIYQNLVPYRTHRDEIGVEMNADYEHALLRLLAGEGDFLSIESKTARKEIQTELGSPNPNTGLYRDFAAADVHLNPEKLDVGFGEEAFPFEEPMTTADEDEEMGMPEMEEHSEEGTVQEGTEGGEGFQRLEVEPLGANLGPVEEVRADEELDSQEVPPEVSEHLEEMDTEDTLEEGGEEEAEKEDLPPFENCPWCREKLPQQARVRFCPFCGSNVQLVPCPSCGEELRLNWRFCIACGTEVDS